MKETIEKILQISLGLDNPEVKQELDSIANSLKSLYLMLNGKLQITTKESIGRKLKLAEAYLKLNDFDSAKVKLAQYLSLILKLSKYRTKAVLLKKMFNSKIKTYFDTKLSNENHKDYNKFKTIATQFNFESDDLNTLDANRTKYELLEIAGTFGNDKLINATLPKPTNNNNPKPGSRFNKK